MNGLISKPFGRKIDIDAAIMQLIAYFCRSEPDSNFKSDRLSPSPAFA